MGDSVRDDRSHELDQLILAARTGNPEAQRELYGRTYERLVHFVQFRERLAYEDAQEVAGDALLIAMDPDKRFTPMERAWSWLMSVAQNKARGLKGRNKKRQSTTDLGDIDPADLAKSAPEVCEAQQWSARLNAVMVEAISQLPDKRRQALRLRLSPSDDQMPIREIARQLACTERYVKKLLREARGAIALFVKREHPDVYAEHRSNFERLLRDKR